MVFVGSGYAGQGGVPGTSYLRGESSRKLLGSRRRRTLANPNVSSLTMRGSAMQSRHESFPPRPVFGVAIALVCAATMLTAQAPPPPAAVPTAGPKGTLERIKVFGKSLEGNLEGDSPDCDVVVYLPPSYAKKTGRRYPVGYFLHGYSVGVEAYVRMLALPEAPDRAMGSGAVREAILVLPDAFTKYSGSM